MARVHAARGYAYGPLVVWKHVADLTDPAAIERARCAQQVWITGLVEVAPA
jgi:hypothetical protein